MLKKYIFTAVIAATCSLLSISDPEYVALIRRTATEMNDQEADEYAKTLFYSLMLNAQDDTEGTTPLIHALINGRFTVANALLNWGADATLEMSQNVKPFELALRWCGKFYDENSFLQKMHAEGILLRLGESGVHVTQRVWNIVDSSSDSLEIRALLLRLSHRIPMKFDSNRNDFIRVARVPTCSPGVGYKIVDTLKKYNLLNTPDVHKKVPLLHAVEVFNLPLGDLLIHAGASAAKTDKEDKTLLGSYLVQLNARKLKGGELKRAISFIGKLLNAGADINDPDLWVARTNVESSVYRNEINEYLANKFKVRAWML